MARRKKQTQQQQETLFDLTPYTRQSDYRMAKDEDIFSDEYYERAMPYLERKPKSSPVERDCVERENFQWIEQYLVRRRYLYWRYCYLSTIDSIEQVVKIHIPGRGISVREGRAQLVREKIAAKGNSAEIEQIIDSWKT